MALLKSGMIWNEVSNHPTSISSQQSATPYSPELNLIEFLWRFMKYEWIEMSTYRSWQS
jgi:transposase